MKSTIRFTALILVFSLPILAYSDESAEKSEARGKREAPIADHIEPGQAKELKPERGTAVETQIKANLKDFGQKLFFDPFGARKESTGDFADYYEHMTEHRIPVTEGNLAKAISTVKPRKDNEDPKVADEYNIAAAITDMWSTVDSRGEAGQKMVEDTVRSIYNEMMAIRKGDSKNAKIKDSQYVAFMKRAWELTQLIVPEEQWPDGIKKDAKKDPSLANFRTAAKKAIEENFKLAQKDEENRKNAPTNEAAQKDYMASLGKSPQSYVLGLIKSAKADEAAGDKDTARQKLAEAASAVRGMGKVEDGKLMTSWNVGGKPQYLDFPNMTEADLKNPSADTIGKIQKRFESPTMKGAEFVGLPHGEGAVAKDQKVAWDAKVGDYKVPPDPKEAEKAANANKKPAADPNAGSGAKTATTAGTSGTSTSEPSGSKGSGDVTSIVSAKCTGCHESSVSGNQVTGMGAPASAATIDKMVKKGAKLTAEEVAALKKFVGGGA